ncbi:hypothetical protein COOONC_20969 [Cooperia oncophora]
MASRGPITSTESTMCSSRWWTRNPTPPTFLPLSLAPRTISKTTVKCRDGAIREVAVKKFRDPFSDNAQARMIYREIKLLQIMRHDGVIRAIDLYTPNNVEHEFKELYVVTGYAGDSIVKILHDQKVTGRVHITPEHIIHRDLKTRKSSLNM